MISKNKIKIGHFWPFWARVWPKHRFVLVLDKNNHRHLISDAKKHIFRCLSRCNIQKYSFHNFAPNGSVYGNGRGHFGPNMGSKIWPTSFYVSMDIY